MGFEIFSVDHDRLLLTMISGLTNQHLGEDALGALPFPTIVKRLVRTVFLGRITPA